MTRLDTRAMPNGEWRKKATNSENIVCFHMFTRTTRPAGTPGRAVCGVSGRRAVQAVHSGCRYRVMTATASGVGALDASESDALRAALLLAASTVHCDAASVLAAAPPTTIWLRPSPGGDGGDLETHVAVAMFWELRRMERKRMLSVSVEDSGVPSDAQPQPKAVPKNTRQAVTVRSAYGLEKTLTALELAVAITEAMPANDTRVAHLLVDARVAPGDSGVIHLTTAKHHDEQRSLGNLRCRVCGRFVAGERALWWHAKTKHGAGHETAASCASDESRSLVKISHEVLIRGSDDTRVEAADEKTTGTRTPCFVPKPTRAPRDLAAGLLAARNGDPLTLANLVSSGKVEALSDPGLDAARNGDLRTLRRLLLGEGTEGTEGWDPKLIRDRHGATALLWAAGAGHLACVRLLCEESRPGHTPVDPADPASHQTGRRAYVGKYFPLPYSAD